MGYVSNLLFIYTFSSRQLTKLGMNVMIANNGQEAVDQWLSVERGHYTIAIFDHVRIKQLDVW